jgi:diketogulonate reductase-like aldo/keto reductase
MATSKGVAAGTRNSSASTNTLQVGALAEPWPTLGLGTWRFGENERKAPDEVSAIRRALEIGYRLFDTAEMYGDGGAERVLGRALREAMAQQQGLRREHLRIVSKAYPHHADVAGLRRACDASRKRLQLDTIDLYLLHWRGSIPLADTLRGFEQLLSKGWIRHWGVSNFDLADLDELRALDGAAACAVNQVYYSISERGIEYELLPRMRQWRMPLMAHTPIDSGRIGQHAKLAALAADLQTSPTQLALAWMLHQPGVMAIPKAGRESHLLENWRAQQQPLSAQVLSALEAMFPGPKRKQPLAMR